jgi:thiol:disulfide interchange protein
MLIFEIMSVRLGSFFLFLMLIFTFSKSPSEVDINTEINWISFEEAVAKTSQNPKMILVDLYTDWCGWCKKWIEIPTVVLKLWPTLMINFMQ